VGPALCGRPIHLSSIWVLSSTWDQCLGFKLNKPLRQPFCSFIYFPDHILLGISPTQQSPKCLLHQCRRGSRSRTCKRSSTTRILCLVSRRETTILTNTKQALVTAINLRSSRHSACGSKQPPRSSIWFIYRGHHLLCLCGPASRQFQHLHVSGTASRRSQYASLILSTHRKANTDGSKMATRQIFRTKQISRTAS
jgi:hypothetical protein